MFYFFFVVYTSTTRETHDEMKGENKANSCIIVILTNANSYMCHVHLCEVSSNEIWISVYTEKLVHTLSHEYHV